MKRFFLILLAVAGFQALAAENMSRVFTVGSNPELLLENISGDIDVQPGASDTVEIDARIQDDRIGVSMEQQGDRVIVKVDYPKDFRGRGGVDFTVIFPAEGRLEIESVSGDIAISDISGNLDLRTVSGDIDARGLSGDLDLASVSGDVEVLDATVARLVANATSGDVVYRGSLSPDGRYTLTTTSGDVRLVYPDGASFRVSASTVSGSIQAGDAGLRVEKPKYGPGASLKGNVGGGGPEIKMTTVSGSVRLERQ